jgi:hypothetical protein
MERQLVLIEEPVDWRLDKRTREIGLKGVALAREAVRQARAQARKESTDAGHSSAA